ncbi:MAG: hypothetical protein H6737_09175 [Alphaproteobacteria bacterium]|nr:hypothetical protein [Alphaproteobacteria bacterium]
MLLFSLLSPAFAGELDVVATFGDETAELHLTGLGTCDTQEVRLGDASSELRAKARAASPEKGQLYVELELEWHADSRRVETRPTVLFRPGEPAVVELGMLAGTLQVEVDGSGFEPTPDAWCLPGGRRPTRAR